MSKVLIADDVPLIRLGVFAQLKKFFEEVVEASSAKEAVEKIIKHQPDLVILDYGLGDGTGMDVYRQSCKKSPGTKFILHSDNSDIYLHYRVLHETNIRAVVKKQVIGDLEVAVNRVLFGQTYYNQDLLNNVIEYTRVTKSLNENQKKILYLAHICGKSNGYIANKINMSERNVTVNRGKIANLLTNEKIQYIKDRFSLYSGQYSTIHSI